ncbi:MAG: hypothetical protein ACR2P3_09750 [Geminicoccaceae bacterium]
MASLGAKAEGIEILAGGELQFGLTIAAGEQLSDGEGDRGYAFLADSELYIEAHVSPSDDLEIGAEVALNADADVEVLEGVELQADVSYADPEGWRTDLASVLALEMAF